MENISLSSACLPSDGKRQIDFVLAHEPPSPFMIDELLGPIKHVVGEWTTIGDHHVGKIVEKETKFVEKKAFCEKGDDEAENCSLGRSSQKSDQKQLADERARHRHTFERNLHQMGLHLERARALHSETNFVLIHAPLNVLLTQAELLQIKMPVRKNDVVGGTTNNSSNKKQQTDSSSPPNSVDEGSEGLSAIFRWWFNLLHFGGELQKRLEPAEYFSQPFVAQHFDCFVGHENPETFFSQADRSRMVYNLLCRARYDSADELCYGIERLVQAEAYNAAYPLHDELYGQNCSTEEWKNAEANYAECSDRQLLYQTWVRLSNFRKYQPLDLIKHYYGTKIGFYYAWLGYYTRCLYPITVIGIFCVAYGFMTASNDVPSNEICAQGGIGTSLVVCPTCEYFCDFTPLIRTCFHSKLTYLFDNNATVLFAIIMSIWTTLFLEGWKRYHAKLAYKWNTLTVIQATEQEALRPEFQHRQRRINPVTGLLEPWMPVLEKGLRICCSAVTIVFFMFLVVAYLVGTIFYAIVVRYVFAENEHSKLLQSNAMFFTFISAALINLIFILLMNFIYNKVAMKLTEWECPRTQSEFDNSYTLKVFLFQFVNYFSYIFYIAFIKGRFTTIPTDRKYAPHALLEQCEAAGCMVELVIQLAVIMIGQQILSAVFEILPPIITQRKEQMRLNLPDDEQILMEEQQRGNNGNGGIKKKTNGKKKQKEKGGKNKENKQQLLCPFQPASKNGTKTKGNEGPDEENEMAPKALHQYELDYSLNPVYPQFIFDEYLKMVIQLGFVTMFAAAFPLAPLFALLNNIFEIRLDAYKFTIKTRRPVAESVRDIGIWYQIINMISYISVLVNAFLIAFTSDFVPRLYYAYNHGGLQGYVDDKFSYFDATELPVPYSGRFFVSNPRNTNSSVAICRYLDYRLPPCSLNNVNQNGETIFALNQQQKQLFSLCSDNYELQPKWWTLFALRLLFVLVFELSIFIIKAIIAYLIPDLPSEVCTQLQREQFLMRQAILEREIAGGGLIEEKEAALIGKTDCQLPPTIVENVEQSPNDEQPTRSARTKRSVMFEPEEEPSHQSTVPHSQQMFLNAALGVGNGLLRLFAQRERPTLSSLKSNRLPGFGQQNNWEAQTMMTPTSSKSAPTTTTMMWIDEEEGGNGGKREKNKK